MSSEQSMSVPSPDEPPQTWAAVLEIADRLNKDMEFENELANRRVNWFIPAQVALAALVSQVESRLAVDYVPFLAAIYTALILTAIITGFVRRWRIKREMDQLVRANAWLARYYPPRGTCVIWLGWLPVLSIPVLVLIIWGIAISVLWSGKPPVANVPDTTCGMVVDPVQDCWETPSYSG